MRHRYRTPLLRGHPGTLAHSRDCAARGSWCSSAGRPPPLGSTVAVLVRAARRSYAQGLRPISVGRQGVPHLLQNWMRRRALESPGRERRLLGASRFWRAGRPYYFKRLKGARGNADPRTRTAATCNEPGGRRGRRLSRLAIRLSSHTPVLPRSLSAGKAKGSERAPHGRSPSGQQASSRHTSSVIPGGLRSRSRTTRARRIPRDRQLQRQQPRDRCRPPRARGTRVTANGPAVIGVHGERYTRPRKPIRPQSGTSG